MTTKQDATTEQLFTAMHEAGSVLNGWGAVFSLDFAHLAQAVLHRLSNADPQGGSPRLDLEFSPPAIRLEWPIPGGRQGDGPASPDVTGPFSLIPLKVETRAGPDAGFSVVLDLSAATRGAGAPEVGSAFSQDPAECDGRAPGLESGCITLLRVDGGAPAGVAALRPTAVALSAQITPMGNRVLQVHIATSAPPPALTGIHLDEPLPTVDGAAWTLIVNAGHLFQDLIVDDFNARSSHLKLEAVPPSAPDQSGWYARSVHRVLFQGTVSWWGDGPPIARQHAQIGLKFRGSPVGRLAVSTYTRPGANVSLQLAVDQSYGVECSGAPGGQQLRLVGSSAAVQGTGIAESTFKPIAEILLNQEVKADLEAVSLAGCAALVQGSLSLPDRQAVIRQAGIPGDLILIGDLLPLGTSRMTADPRPSLGE